MGWRLKKLSAWLLNWQCPEALSNVAAIQDSQGTCVELGWLVCKASLSQLHTLISFHPDMTFAINR